VYAGAESIRLEKYAYNCANFGIPDERGWVAENATIVEGQPEALKTTLPYDAILEKLQSKELNIVASDDPGRYICNYVYYSSLAQATGNKSNQVRTTILTA